jgi:hypothetical protein
VQEPRHVVEPAAGGCRDRVVLVPLPDKGLHPG